MAVIYLKHPKHGIKVATMHLEAEADIKNGWIPYDPDLPTGPLTDEPTAAYNGLVSVAPARKAK